jgi:hypothetical protein
MVCQLLTKQCNVLPFAGKRAEGRAAARALRNLRDFASGAKRYRTAAQRPPSNWDYLRGLNRTEPSTRIARACSPGEEHNETRSSALLLPKMKSTLSAACPLDPPKRAHAL